MTRLEFIERVGRLGHAFLDGDAVRYVGDGGEHCCPITATCLLEQGAFFALEEWEEAAEDLGLSYEDACAIALCADGGADPEVPGDRELRAALLAAAGLVAAAA